MLTVGIDAGYLTTKAVVIENRKIIAGKTTLTGESGFESIVKTVESAMSIADVKANQIANYVSTGVGKGEIPYTGTQATEILCAVKGALFYYPSAQTVIDMGAESVRVIRCNHTGRVLDFVLNDKCAAGTGIFLDTLIKILEINIEDSWRLSLQAKEDIAITSTCAVFAESEVVGLIAQGKERASILNGINRSIASRIYGLVNKVGISEGVVFIGGGAKNTVLVKCLTGLIKQELLIPKDPQIVGAIGAALIAQERG